MAPSADEIPGMELVRDMRTLASAISACAASTEKYINYYASLTGHEETGKRKRVAKVARDPLQPKRPASSFLLYQIEKRQQLKKTYPELSHQELGKLISQEWASMSDAAKKPYVDRHAEADKKYKSDMTDYKATAAANGDSPSPLPVADKKPKKEKAATKPKVQAKDEGSKSKKPTKTPEVVSDSDEDEEDDDDEESAASSSGKANGDDSDSSGSSSEEEEAPPPKKHKAASKEQEKKKRKA